MWLRFLGREAARYPKVTRSEASKGRLGSGRYGGAVDSGRRGGVVALVLASLLWGTTGPAATFFPDDVSPLAIGACTMGIGGLLLFLTAIRPSVGVLRDRTARRWVALGALGVVVY